MNKKIISIVGLLLVPVLVFALGGQVSSRQFTKTNASTSSPVRLAAQGTFATKVTIIGNKSARVANTGTVYIGPTSTDDAQAIAVTTGQTVTITPAQGEFIDLYEWYLDPATANDGVVVIYTF
jgi:hypothetical protein